MQKITPFLWFDNNAEEAAQFYTSVFKNSRILSVSRYGDAGPGPKGSVMVVSFQLEGQQFAALNGGPLFKFSEAFSFVVSCENQQEIDDYWNKLTSGGGQESQCGWLKDKFGFSWQIVPTALGKLMTDTDPKKANRVMQALLQMKNLDLATLEQAVEGTDVFFHIFAVLGAGNRDDVVPLGEQPCKRELAGCAPFLARERFDAPDKIEILLEVLPLKTRMVLAPIVLGNVFRSLDLAREEAAAERTVGDEADAELANGWQDLVLDVAGPQRVFRLQCGDGMYRVSAAQRLGGRL